MSGKYSITSEEERQQQARQEHKTRDVTQEIKEIIGTTISAKYNEFIFLQYQLHCDEYDASNIIIESAKSGRITEPSFLLHCQQRKKYCCNQMWLLDMTYPQLYKARRASDNQRI